MIIALVTYAFSFFFLYFAGRYIMGFFVWDGTEFFYFLGNLIVNNTFFFLFLYLAVGFLIILLYYWRKIFGYFNQVVEATESLYKEEAQLIRLSPELSDVESQLNHIKITNLNNLRLSREAEQRKNDLVAYLAHDLKTPITSVIGYLTLLRDEGQISEELRQRYLSISLDKAERLDDLINEFFEITRFNISSISLEKKSVNLSRMLNQLVFEFAPMFKEKSLSCDLVAPDSIMVRCDPDKLQRVFDNLLRNAVSYSAEESTICISASANEDQIFLQFENSGETISPEKLERLFEQFYRLDTARSSENGGAGLGLAIAKEIIELHGGTITAFSEHDRVCFDVTLPVGNS
ncbi:two-component system sensor histidine kinase VanS [Clostridiales Family XIII bacterium PM5-7]